MLTAASTFDFSDLGTIAGIEIDHADDRGAPGAQTAGGEDLPIFQGRDRAFSFEVFNFSGGDDLLPNPVESAAPIPSTALAPVGEHPSTSRPRGDSIIFDPCSFQEGGIHEQNALHRAPSQQEAQQHQQQLPPQAVHSMSAPPHAGRMTTQAPPRQRARPQHGAPRGRPPTSSAGRHSMSHHPMSHSGNVPEGHATLPSSLTQGGAVNTQSPATFQMDLLNKDGRIGIYLPEARRARIARFHAKRKMRIWRKRIKYDCRKKLADSRPRIKGRFVKRVEPGEINNNLLM